MTIRKKIKIGILSDTHVSGPDERLRRIIDDHFSGVDMIFHAGDLVDLSVLDLFGEKDVRAVSGNMDTPRVKQALPERLILELNGFRVGLIHGWGAPDGMEKKLVHQLGRLDCIVFGHTHAPVNQVIDGVRFFNPGSALDRRFAPFCSVGILEVGDEITGSIIALKA